MIKKLAFSLILLFAAAPAFALCGICDGFATCDYDRVNGYTCRIKVDPNTQEPYCAEVANPGGCNVGGSLTEHETTHTLKVTDVQIEAVQPACTGTAPLQAPADSAIPAPVLHR
jgi:hypothetical protein